MNLALQDGIFKAQDLMLQMPQAETVVTDHFADGLYARVIHSGWRMLGWRVTRPIIYSQSQKASATQ